MNSLLRFRDRNVEKRYYKELTPYLQTMLTILVCLFVFKQVFWIVGLIVLDLDEVCEDWVVLLFTSIASGVGCVLLYLLKRKLNCITNIWFCRNPKYLTWFIDLVVMTATYYTLFRVIPFEEEAEDDGSLEIFFRGWMWFFQLYVSVFMMFNWISRSFFIGSLLVYGGVQDLDLSELKDRTRVLNIVLNCMMAIAIYYSVEKSRRKMFLNRDKLMQRSEAWKKMYDQFPEGFALMNKDGKMLFHNQTLSSLTLRNPTEAATVELSNLVRFENLTVGFCDESLKHLPTTYDESNLPTARIQEETQPDQQNNYKDLMYFLMIFLEHWKTTSRYRSPQSASVFPNDQHLILLDSQINHASQYKSYQIKMWFTLFEGEQVLALLFSETTQMKLVHTLQDRDVYRSRLLASVSHELRTPLNGSTNFMERILEDGRVPEDLKESYVRPALRSNTLLLNIINDLLDFSQLQANKLRLNFKVADICKDIRECLKLFEIQTKLKNISLTFEAPDKSFDSDFSTDHNRVKQILLNLLSNSVKFTREGSIRVTVSEVKTEGLMERQIKIKVKDTGIGIPEEEQKKLFTEFTHIENYDRGTVNPNGVGLGLMISNSLATRLGPKFPPRGLGVKSQVGVGTTFSIILEEKHESENKLIDINRGLEALIQGQTSRTMNSQGGHKKTDSSLVIEMPTFWRNNPEKTANMTRTLETSPDQEVFVSLPIIPDERVFDGTNMRLLLTFQSDYRRNQFVGSKACDCPEILVVDDDGFNIMAVESIFRSLGMKNDRAFNGEDAIVKMKARAQNTCGPGCSYYKLVLMDCTMPVMDGFEAARIIKNLIDEGKIPKTFVVACSALAYQEGSEETMTEGMDDFCVKPVAKDKIIAILKKIDRNSI